MENESHPFRLVRTVSGDGILPGDFSVISHDEHNGLVIADAVLTRLQFLSDLVELFTSEELSFHDQDVAVRRKLLDYRNFEESRIAKILRASHSA